MASLAGGVSDSSAVRFNHLWSVPLIAEKGCPIDDLEVDRECDAIKKSLVGNCIDWRSTVAHKREFLHCMQHCDILHFTGHGTSKGIALEYDAELGDPSKLGECQFVSPDDLRKMPFGQGKVPKLVFVSACHSELIGRVLVDCGVQHVVAIDKATPVLDKASLDFAGLFYRELFEGKSVREAFDTSRGSVRLEKHAAAGRSGLREEDKFLLLPDDPARALVHDQPVVARAEGQLSDATPDFLGRPSNLLRSVRVCGINAQGRWF